VRTNVEAIKQGCHTVKTLDEFKQKTNITLQKGQHRSSQPFSPAVPPGGFGAPPKEYVYIGC